MATTDRPEGWRPYDQSIREGRIHLREWRRHAGLSQEELARRLGVRHSAISRWENGKRPITLDQLACIAKEVIPGRDAGQAVVTLFQRPPPAPSAEPAQSDEDAREIAELWAELTPEKRQLLREIVRLLRAL